MVVRGATKHHSSCQVAPMPKTMPRPGFNFVDAATPIAVKERAPHAAYVRTHMDGSAIGRIAKPNGAPQYIHTPEAGTSAAGGSGDYDSEDDAENEADAENGKGSSSKDAGKLWTKAQFPEGITGAANYDIANLTAAQDWTCPCSDRRNCIGVGRLDVVQLYQHRKDFQTTCASSGGKRDTARASMAGHYNSASRTMSRSFVVGPLNDCCAASAGLASGLSFHTFERARSDLRGGAPLRTARRKAAADKQSSERRHLEAYIRDLRSSMEGSKGKAAVGRWFTGRRPVPQRWEDYRKSRMEKQLPVIGSLALFKKLWAAHEEIVEQKATGHDICDECGANKAARDKYEGRTDECVFAGVERVHPNPSLLPSQSQSTLEQASYR